MRPSYERRVVITGLGVISAIGVGKDALWQGVLEGRRGVRRITRFDPAPFSSRIAAEVDTGAFDPLDYMDAKRARRLDRFSQFGLVASRMAVDDARLDLEREDRGRVGVFLGSALGGVAYAEEQHGDYAVHGLRAVSPMLALAVFGGAAGANIAMDLGAAGPSIANANSCASGTIAVGEAFRTVARGDADIVVAGAAEAPLAPLTFGAFAIIRALSTRNDDPAAASRPFDRDRDGFVMAEGAGVLVLEELGHAVRRDAPIYGEVLGFGATNDAYHMTAPRPGGAEAARAAALALDDAGLLPTDIDYIAAHASATALGDAAEVAAITQVFGEHARRIPVSATKGMHGHALGATGAIELAITALALRHEMLPATVNLCHPDPESGLVYVRDRPLPYRATHVLKNSFGFGGINAALALGRYE